ILLVDDHEALAGILVAILAQEGYEVVWARDGEQACQLLTTEPFHLVVTDSALPERSGWEVASDAKKRGLPVILSSGWPVRLRPDQLSAQGVDFLCPKPCQPRQLLSLVKKALRKSPRKVTCGTLVPESQYQSHR
ncbi:MAG: response regulator, partial [Acidobacteria bacterium]|nr:response regulator [Acidobacteriota bacterium]